MALDKKISEVEKKQINNRTNWNQPSAELILSKKTILYPKNQKASANRAMLTINSTKAYNRRFVILCSFLSPSQFAPAQLLHCLYFSGGLGGGTNVAQVLPDSGWYCAVWPGIAGMRMRWLHAGHWISRPENCGSHCKCWLHLGQENLKWFMGPFVSDFQVTNRPYENPVRLATLRA
jgi:hypothetical protein